MSVISRRLPCGIISLVDAANQNQKLLANGIRIGIANQPLSSKFEPRGYYFLNLEKDGIVRNIDVFHYGSSISPAQKIERLVAKAWQDEQATKIPQILRSPIYGTKLDTRALPKSFKLEMRPSGCLIINGCEPVRFKGFCRFQMEDQVSFSSCTILRAVQVASKILLPDDATLDKEPDFPVIDLIESGVWQWRISNVSERYEGRSLLSQLLKSTVP